MISSNFEDYREKTRTRLQKIRTRINTLEKQAAQAEADIAVRYDQKMDQIRGQYAQVKDKLEDLGRSRQVAWVDQKAELERAIEMVSESIDILSRQMSI